jgi:type I restriction enzyme S subunit
MKRYDSYKDSGIEWIGEIPSHWDVKRGDSFFKLKKNLKKKVTIQHPPTATPVFYPQRLGNTGVGAVESHISSHTGRDALQ